MGIVFSEFTAITIIGVTLGAIVFALTDYNVVAGFGAVLFAGTALVCTFLTGAVAHFTNTSKALRTGER